MATRQMLVPGPDHPITLTPGGRAVVRVGGQTVAETDRAIVLRESNYPPVWYVPREDATLALLERSAHTSYCPYKGEAAYYSIVVDGDRRENAIWTYEAPYDAVAAIRDHLAFYPDRVDSIETS